MDKIYRFVGAYTHPDYGFGDPVVFSEETFFKDSNCQAFIPDEQFQTLNIPKECIQEFLGPQYTDKIPAWFDEKVQTARDLWNRNCKNRFEPGGDLFNPAEYERLYWKKSSL